jgi:ABC-type multidrug transport system fused ATPase/permease subunit
VFERLREMAEGRTAVFVSHRYSTVRRADHIVVLQRGHIIEEGTHDALVALGGRYAKNFALQAEGYR